MSAGETSAGPRALLGLPLLLAASLGGTFLTFRRTPADAGATEFSAGRALEVLADFAAEPRVAGTESHARAQETILRVLTQADAEPALERGAVTFSRSGAEEGDEPTEIRHELVNLLGRLPGTDSSGTVLFVAHYDSVEESPGAGDDGAACVALLQAIELLASGEPLRNDVRFLFTDGEELGLLGSGLFAYDGEGQDPFADLTCVVNLDAIGNSGVQVLFEVGPGSGALVESYARAVGHPVASSISRVVYERLPNDTDFTRFREAGLPGLNLAIVGGGSAYHAPFDRAENLSPATLQIVGDTVLALARELGTRDLSALERTERTFFDVAGLGVVHFGVGVSWTLFLAAALLLVLAARAVARRAQLSAGVLLAGVGAHAGLLLVAALVLFGAWFLLGALGAELTGVAPEEVRPRGNFVSATLTLVGLACLGALTSSATVALGHARGERALAALVAGGLLLWLPLLAHLAWVGPTTGAQVPLAAILAAGGALASERLRLALPLGCALAAFLLAPHLALVFHLLSRTPHVAAIVVALCVPTGFAPLAGWLARYPAGRRSLLILGVLGAALVVAGARLAYLGR